MTRIETIVIGGRGKNMQLLLKILSLMRLNPNLMQLGAVQGREYYQLTGFVLPEDGLYSAMNMLGGWCTRLQMQRHLIIHLRK
jgi:hypothetical protein